MKQSTIKRYLEVGSGFAVLVVALMLLGTFISNYFRATPSGLQLQPGLRREMLLGPIAGVEYADAPQTMLIAMNTNSQACTLSVPFYNRLAEAEQRKNRAIRIIGVFPEGFDKVHQYREQTHLEVKVLAGAPMERLGVAHVQVRCASCFRFCPPKVVTVL